MGLELREVTCCFTGHRKIPPKVVPILIQALEHTLCQLIENGIRYFGAGGARGFDTLAAEAVLRLKAHYPHIRLILVLPCIDQTRGWSRQDIVRYHSILAVADKVVYTGTQYSPGSMHRRNRHLVDHSSVCVAYCAKSTGGTAYTVRYAQSRNLKIFTLLDDYA